MKNSVIKFQAGDEVVYSGSFGTVKEVSDFTLLISAPAFGGEIWVPTAQVEERFPEFTEIDLAVFEETGTVIELLKKNETGDFIIRRSFKEDIVLTGISRAILRFQDECEAESVIEENILRSRVISAVVKRRLDQKVKAKNL